MARVRLNSLMHMDFCGCKKLIMIKINTRDDQSSLVIGWTFYKNYERGSCPFILPADSTNYKGYPAKTGYRGVVMADYPPSNITVLVKNTPLRL